MSDLLLSRRPDGNFDLSFDEKDKDLVLSDGLRNAVAISIGTFARSRSLGNAANLEPSIGGWFGDSLDESGTLGGYLYEAFPGKLTDDTCRNLETLSVEALDWMKKDGIAKSVNASAKIQNESTDTVELEISIKKPENSESFKFEINRRAAIDGV